MGLSHVIRNLFRPVARTIRRAAGMDLVQSRLVQLEALQRHNSETLALLTNALAASRLPLGEVVGTAQYERAAKVVAQLAPMDCAGVAFTRVGRSRDGGYVMLDELTPPRVTTAYSFGIADDVSWELDIAERGVEVYMFDHTIAKLPLDHRRFHYARLGITGHRQGPLLHTLPDLLERNGHAGRDDMILKLDVEGCEWDVLAQCPRATLESFTQIVLELHNVVPMLGGREPFATLDLALSRLTASHQCVHVHANNYAPTLVLPGMVLPSAIECTFASRRVYGDRFTPCTRSFPTSLDAVCTDRHPEPILGRFAAPATGSAP